jgi:hypothetical protein
MTVGLVVPVASVLVALVFGLLVGYGLSKRKFTARAKRQIAAQTSIYRQLYEFQAARQRGRPSSMQKNYSVQAL